MSKVYLFDWGDTLMVDFPDGSGKMCDWAVVKAEDGAEDVLAHLSKTAKIYIATGAADSSELDIQAAFKRVNLSQYISGYFCQSNLGVSKGSAEFYRKILAKLREHPGSVVMVGDSLDDDIKPATAVGIQAIWFDHGCGRARKSEQGIRRIKGLRELID